MTDRAIRYESADHVGWPARRKRHDQAHGFVRIVLLRPGGQAARGQIGADGGQGAASSDRHRCPLSKVVRRLFHIREYIPYYAIKTARRELPAHGADRRR